MYRRKPKPQTKLAEYPADLQALGLFIHPEADQIRQIEKPDEPFHYHLYGKASSMDVHRRNERLNRRRGEAVHECMRSVALQRLAELNVHPVSLPVEAEKDPAIKHVQILISSGLNTAKRVVLVAPDSESSGLGIHSFRNMIDIKVGGGCMQSFVKAANAAGFDGVVIANPATIYWDRSTKSAISNVTWKARELVFKQSAHGAILDSQEHVIPGHESPEAHIASVMEYLKTQLSADAEFDFVATGYTSYALLAYLSRNYEAWKENLHAGVLAESGHSIDDFKDARFRDFVRKRCRNYVLHADPMGTYLEPNMVTAVGTFSSGTTTGASEVVPAILSQIFGYFKKARELDEKAKLKGGKAQTDGYSDSEESEEDELNPAIPISMGPEFGSAHEEWMAALSRLNLGEEVPGWKVPGAEEVEALKKKAEEQEIVVEQWKAEALAQGKDVKVYEDV